MAYRSFRDIFRWWAPEESTKVHYAQPLPPLGLAPSLDNLEIRLGRCEYGSCPPSFPLLPILCCQFACLLVLVRVLELCLHTADRIHMRHAYASALATCDAHQEMLAERAASSGSRDPDDSRSEEGTFRPFNELHAPLRLAAPEAIRGAPHPYSPPINVWAVGHLVSSAAGEACSSALCEPCASRRLPVLVCTGMWLTLFCVHSCSSV